MTRKRFSDSNRPVGVGNILDELFARRKWQHRIGLHEVFRFWGKAVGKDVAVHAQPHLIRGSVLWVRVSDSVWMQQLQFQKTLLLAEINERLGQEKMTDIRFQLSANINCPSASAVEETPSLIKIPETKKQNEFNDLISSLPDEELKQTMKNIWLKLHGKRDGGK